MLHFLFVPSLVFCCQHLKFSLFIRVQLLPSGTQQLSNLSKRCIGMGLFDFAAFLVGEVHVSTLPAFGGVGVFLGFLRFWFGFLVRIVVRIVRRFIGGHFSLVPRFVLGSHVFPFLLLLVRERLVTLRDKPRDIPERSIRVLLLDLTTGFCRVKDISTLWLLRRVRILCLLPFLRRRCFYFVVVIFIIVIGCLLLFGFLLLCDLFTHVLQVRIKIIINLGS
mmetsp:Transcript_12810/g.35484  ORF Transcript_12810/g.35484 Transcript_12810/m.35484 type:complete len:221 (-) Transcript_12810:175-837(-)